jgi:NAD(P)-dependent dehydrogenase (short-subunit alcohol dehydrogenase family)
MTDRIRLQGKLALVTGVTSGIGAATVRALLAQEALVVGVGRDAQRLEAATRDFGPGFRPLQADLAVPEQRRRLIADLSTSRAPEIFISNAAECLYESPLDVPASTLSRLLEINVTAAIELTQAVAARMRPGAHIVQISSVVARHLPSAKFAPYAASKAALDCLSEALRLELHPRGIHVSTLAPGLVDTPIYDKVEGFERAREKIREQVPTWLSAEDVAETLLWMLSRPERVVVAEMVRLPSKQAR